MKKLIIIPILLFFMQGQSQTIDSLVGIVNGHPGKLIKDTALSVIGNYLTTPSSTSLGFDSSKVGVSIVKNATRDSFELISGSGSILAKVKDSVGAGGSGTSVGGDHAVQYDSSGSFSGNQAFLYADYINKRLGIGGISSYALDIQKSSNAAERVSIINTSTGTAAQALFQAQNNASNVLQMGVTSGGYTTSGTHIANMSYVQMTAGSRLLIAAQDLGANPPIVFAGGSGMNTELWRIDNATGNWSNTGGAGTGYINLKAGTTSDAQIQFTSGVAPTSPTSGGLWYETTNTKLMFRQNTTSVELMGASAVNTVSPTSPNRTISVTIGGVTYYIAAKTTND